MIHPDTELRFINDTIGYGVVATRFIPKGTITWVQDDLDKVYTSDDISRLNPIVVEHLEKYSFTNAKGQKVLCWDNARFVNHSFRPSCMSTAYDFEIAIRDIHPGEQLTDDYGYLNIEEPFEAEDEGTDRKIVYPDDILRYYREWDAAIEANFGTIGVVSQPLKAYVSPANWEAFSKAMRGEAPLRSIKTCYFEHKVANRH